MEAVGRFRDRYVGEIGVNRVELTLLDLKKEYPEPQTVATIRLGGGSPRF